MRNPNNILRHELIGLSCEIVLSQNKSQIGIRGRIIDETMKMIIIKENKSTTKASNQNSKKSVQKKGTIFRVNLGQQKLDIDGNFIIARPEDRIKKKFKKW